MSELLRRQIARRVVTARKELGLSQARLAERCGISVEFVSRIERAVGLPALPTLVRLASALECTPNDLLLPDAELRSGNAALERLARQLEGAPRAIEREVVRIAEALVAYDARGRATAPAAPRAKPTPRRR